MDIVEIATGQLVSREACEAAINAAQPATVIVEQTNTVENEDGTSTSETVEVEIPNEPDFRLPLNLMGIDLSEHGFSVVYPSDPPTLEPGEVAERDGIEEVEGVWRWKWAVRPMNGDEIASAKQAKWSEIKGRRDVAIDAGCSVPGVGVFDTDLLSRTNINGAVTAASIALSQSQPFSAPWKLQDNSIVTLDAPTMIAAGMAVMQRTSDCHANAQALGLALEAEQDAAAVVAFDIETGWPS